MDEWAVVVGESGGGRWMDGWIDGWIACCGVLR